jgi:hypothetical protein
LEAATRIRAPAESIEKMVFIVGVAFVAECLNVRQKSSAEIESNLIGTS